jgi:flagellar biosynthesis/type III secretory pathway M-ring protein FliF/YscJ
VLDRERALLDQPAPAVPGRRGLNLDLGMPAIAGAGVFVVVVLAVLVWLTLRGRARTRVRDEIALSLERGPQAAAAATAQLVRETGMAPAVAAAAVAAMPRVAPTPRAPQPIVPEDMLQLTQEREDIREKAMAMATSEPDATAQLLRAWLVKKKPGTMMTGVPHGGS